jgi:hypothetical protein
LLLLYKIIIELKQVFVVASRNHYRAQHSISYANQVFFSALVFLGVLPPSLQIVPWPLQSFLPNFVVVVGGGLTLLLAGWMK